MRSGDLCRQAGGSSVVGFGVRVERAGPESPLTFMGLVQDSFLCEGGF